MLQQLLNLWAPRKHQQENITILGQARRNMYKNIYVYLWFTKTINIIKVKDTIRWMAWKSWNKENMSYTRRAFRQQKNGFCNRSERQTYHWTPLKYCFAASSWTTTAQPSDNAWSSTYIIRHRILLVTKIDHNNKTIQLHLRVTGAKRKYNLFGIVIRSIPTENITTRY